MHVLNLNTEPSVELALHGRAVDTKFTLDRITRDSWKLHIKDVFGLEDFPIKEATVFLTDAEAAAIIALFLAGDVDEFGPDNCAADACYEIASPKMDGLPLNLRLIP